MKTTKGTLMAAQTNDAGGSTLTHLECSKCGERFPADAWINTCTACGKVLLARYDLAAAQKTMTPAVLKERAWDLHRYREILPIQDVAAAPSLGEGGTPLHDVPTL